MVTAGAKPKPTYEDYLNIPGDDRYELINGEFILVGSPNESHQAAVMGFALELGFFVRDKGLGRCYVVPFDVLLTDALGVNVVQPDLIFVSSEREHIITRANIQGAPDLVVEILSPSSRRQDTTTKLELYAKHGVREYWIADPESRTVIAMLLKDGKFEIVGKYGVDDTLSSPTLQGVSARLDEIFVYREKLRCPIPGLSEIDLMAETGE